MLTDWWLFCFSLASFVSFLLLLLALLSYIGKRYLLHLDSPQIHRVHIAVDQSQCRLYRINRHARLGRPLISGPSRDYTNGFPSSLTIGTHNTIDHLIYRPITTVSNDQVVTLFDRPGCQFHCMASVLFHSDVRFPTGC